MYSNIFYIAVFEFFIYFCDAKKYTNYTLYRGIPLNITQLQFFETLWESYDVNYWTEPAVPYEAVDFVVSPVHKVALLDSATKLGIQLSTIMSNVQSAFDKQTVQKYIRREVHSMNWHSYFALQDIYNWLKDLSKTYPNYVKLQSLGVSHENRPILAVKVALNNKSRSIIMLEGGIHAREWISPAFVTYMINEIVHAPYSKNQHLKYIANTYEWYFVPVMNPDGYEYTHRVDRLWRKNRHGEGVDLNRNFDIAFSTVGVSFSPSHSSYCGPYAFSEAETQAMKKLISEVGKRIEYYISFHSYGQYMIIPYTHSEQHEENYDQVYLMCKETARQISKHYSTEYKVGLAYDTVGYKTSGVSACWAKKNYHIPYVLVIELRDTGTYGFSLPTDQILPTCEETMDGLMAFFDPRTKRIRKINYINSNQVRKLSDQIVLIVLNVLLFIIVRFD